MNGRKTRISDHFIKARVVANYSPTYVFPGDTSSPFMNRVLASVGRGPRNPAATISTARAGELRRELISARRIVVKLGSAVVTRSNGAEAIVILYTRQSSVEVATQSRRALKNFFE